MVNSADFGGQGVSTQEPTAIVIEQGTADTKVRRNNQIILLSSGKSRGNRGIKDRGYVLSVSVLSSRQLLFVAERVSHVCNFTKTRPRGGGT